MKKILLWVGVSLMGLLVVVGGAAWIALDSQTVGQAILARISEASGLELQAGSVDLGIFSGIELKDVTASGQYSRGDYTVHLARILFRHRLPPLLRGEIVVTEAVLDEPRVEIVIRKPESEEAQDGGTSSHGLETLPDSLRLEVKQITLGKGTMLVREELPQQSPRDQLRLEGIRLVLNNIVLDAAQVKPVDRLSGVGEIQIERAQLGELPLRNLRGEIKVQRGLLSADQLSLSSDEGDLEASLAADFNPVPFTYQLKATASRLNLNKVVGLEEDQSLGPGRLTFDGHGAGSSPAGLVGQGTVHLDPGRIPKQPILSTAERILGMRGLVGGEYEATDAKFQIAASRVTIRDFSLTSQQAGLSLDGEVDLSGPLQLQIHLRAKSSEMSVPGVPRQVLKTLSNDEGWVTVPLKVTGTRDNPRVEPDTGALLAEAGNRFLRRFGFSGNN